MPVQPPVHDWFADTFRLNLLNALSGGETIWIVDQSDFAVFQRCYSGEDNPADPGCAD